MERLQRLEKKDRIFHTQDIEQRKKLLNLAPIHQCQAFICNYIDLLAIQKATFKLQNFHAIMAFNSTIN